MIVRLILWLCAIWVPAVEYIFMANETKFKKNIAIGVTLPYEGRTDPEVQERLKRFKRQLGTACLILTALALLGLFLPLSMGASLTLMLVWTDLAIAAPMVVYALCNRDLKRIKVRRGWRRMPERTVTVDLSAAAQPARELSFLHFLPPLLLSLVPVVWELAAGEALLGVVMLVDPLCVALFWLLYRYAFRRKSEIVDDDTARTQALTRLRRQYWRRTWLWASWYMALLSLCLELCFCAPLTGGIAIGAVTLALVIAAFRMELKLRQAQEKLTADSGTGWYVDEDNKWIWGMFYYDPNDRRLVVNDRVGINTSVNLARRGGKAIMGVAAALLIFMPLMGVWIMGEEEAPVELVLTQDALTASHSGSRYQIGLDEIRSIELLDDLPAGLRRMMGTAMDTVQKGRYTSTELGRLTLCLDPRTGPWLLVTTEGGVTYLLGSSTAGAAEAVFAAVNES